MRRLAAFLMVAMLGWGACERTAVATSKAACAQHPTTPACVAKYGTPSPSTAPVTTGPAVPSSQPTTTPAAVAPSTTAGTIPTVTVARQGALAPTGIQLNGGDIAWTVGLLALVGVALMIASHRKRER
jgi:hypothetical protein